MLQVEDPAVSKNLYKKGSLVHRKKVRAWQMLCVLSPFLEGADVALIRPLVARAVQVQNMSSVRQYVEQFAVQVYLRFPQLVRYQKAPSCFISLVLVCCDSVLIRFKHIGMHPYFCIT